MIHTFKMTIVAFAAVGGAALTAQHVASAQTPQPTNAPVVALLGCVERMTPAAPPTNPKAPVVPTFKIVDVGPGAGQQPATLATEYLIVGPESIPFAKYQNQWVELTGAITAVPTPSPTPAGRGQAPTPLSTFTVKALKVISTECKGALGGFAPRPPFR